MNEMENALRAAASGLWKDISEIFNETRNIEKIGRGFGKRRGGGDRS
jgi:hypothetical protein